MLGIDSEYLAGYQRDKFWQPLLENCEKLPVIHSIEKPILLNLINLSTIFCPRLYYSIIKIWFSLKLVNWENLNLSESIRLSSFSVGNYL